MTNQVETKRDEREPLTTDALEEVVDRLTFDQMRFVVARQEHPSDKEAAESIGFSPQTIKNWKYAGVPIDEAVRLLGFDGLVIAKKMRRRNLAKAMAVKVAGLDEDDSRLRQGVATEIIEWEMGKATQRQEHSGPDGGPIETKVTNDYSPAEHARAIAAFVQAFGSTGHTPDDREQDAMDATERETVAGNQDAGG